MDEKFKDVNKELDDIISPGKYFTDEERQRIRSEIAQLKSSSPSKRFTFFPQALTILTACAFFLFVGGFIGKELGLFSKGDQTTPPNDNTPPVTFPENVNKERVYDGPLFGSFIDIETGQQNVTTPDIFDDTVVWIGEPMDEEARLNQYDLITYKNGAISDIFKSEFAGEVLYPQINADWITWVDSERYVTANDWRIYAYNRHTEKKFVIRESKDVPGHDNPHIVIPRLAMSTNTNMLTWIESVEGEDTAAVQLFDLDKMELETVGEAEIFNTVPQISDKYLVWSKREYEAVIYSLEDRKVEMTLLDKVKIMLPQVNNESIVWSSENEKGELRLLTSKIEGGMEIEVSKGPINWFSISDDFIVYEAEGQITAYLFKTSEYQKLGDGEFPYARGNQVIWQLPRNDDFTITFRSAELMAGINNANKEMWQTAIKLAKEQTKDKELEKWMIRTIMQHSVYGDGIKGKEAVKLAKERMQFEKAWLDLATKTYNITFTDAEVDEFISNGPDIWAEELPEVHEQAKAFDMTIYEMNHVYDRDFYVKWVVWAKLQPILADKYGIDLDAVITDPNQKPANSLLVELYDKEIQEYLRKNR